jgi:hypothetical protein
MNQKENFVNVLRDFTRDGKQKWQIDSASAALTRLILNADMVSQVFSSGINGHTVYFVVQKQLKYFPEFDQHYEQYHNFLLVFNNYNLVYSIYEHEVPEDILNTLLRDLRETLENDFYVSFMKAIK